MPTQVSKQHINQLKDRLTKYREKNECVTQKEQQEELRHIEQARIDKENELALEKERQALAEALQRVTSAEAPVKTAADSQLPTAPAPPQIQSQPDLAQQLLAQHYEQQQQILLQQQLQQQLLQQQAVQHHAQQAVQQQVQQQSQKQLQLQQELQAQQQLEQQQQLLLKQQLMQQQQQQAQQQAPPQQQQQNTFLANAFGYSAVSEKEALAWLRNGF